VPLPETEYLTDNTLILPLYHQMSESEQARIIDVLRAGSKAV
jgi:dTDP-4-amino-4,6-dideoxygalactose transaminase